MEQTIKLNKKNFDFAVRSVYEFQDEQYWHDLRITNIDVRFFIDRTFLNISGLNPDSLFNLIYDLYQALINKNTAAGDRFLATLEQHQHYDKGFSPEALDTDEDALMSITYTLENPNHAKDVDARIDDDFLAMAHDFVSARRLLKMKDIEAIENTGEQTDVRHHEKQTRQRHYKMLEDEEAFNHFTEAEDEERAFEDQEIERDLARLEAHSSKHSRRDTHRRGRGILKKYNEITRNLRILFSSIKHTQ